MWRIAVCDGNDAEREQLLGYIRCFCEERDMMLSAQGVADWPELFEQLKEAEPDIIIIAQDGVDGLNTITGVHLPPGKFIWFSNLDFAVQAYRLCVSWFGKKPVTYQQMEQALFRCMETVSRNWDTDNKNSKMAKWGKQNLEQEALDAARGKQGGNENDTK